LWADEKYSFLYIKVENKLDLIKYRLYFNLSPNNNIRKNMKEASVKVDKDFLDQVKKIKKLTGKTIKTIIKESVQESYKGIFK